MGIFLSKTLDGNCWQLSWFNNPLNTSNSTETATTIKEMVARKSKEIFIIFILINITNVWHLNKSHGTGQHYINIQLHLRCLKNVFLNGQHSESFSQKLFISFASLAFRMITQNGKLLFCFTQYLNPLAVTIKSRRNSVIYMLFLC